jgi:hydroxymethylbilane synthase
MLEANGRSTDLCLIKSEGDIDLRTPLYEMGVQGIFTRSLDMALLNDQVDLAVHSLKDVPTKLPEGIVQAAVLARASSLDLLIPKEETSLSEIENKDAVIATSSTRRRAQWLNRFPNHNIENLRGNVGSRLQKLNTNDWDGAIFAAAGLDRTGLRPAKAIELDWMLPAPAQGAIVVVCRSSDIELREILAALNDAPTALCVGIERAFLRGLGGGCTAPIGALATQRDGMIHFKGNLLSADGTRRIDIERTVSASEASGIGTECARAVLEQGGREIMEELRKNKQSETSGQDL